MCQLLRTAVLLQDSEAATARRFMHQHGEVVADNELGPGVLLQLCSSGAAHNVVSTAQALYPLLLVAVSQGNRYDAVAALVELHAAASQVSAKQLVQLLHLGMQTGATELQHLAELSTALQDMSAAAIEGLLTQAVQQQGLAAVGVVQCLASCPAVRQLSNSSGLQLVRMALQGSVDAAAAEPPEEECEAEGSMLCLMFSDQMGAALEEVLGPDGVAAAV
jgi:hypothetical protein